MSNLDFLRCRALNLIPNKKIESKFEEINNSTDDIKTKNLKITAINRFAESNIPLEYWGLKMEKDFYGNPKLKEIYNDYTVDLKKSYIEGTSFCLAGSHGNGKTLTVCNILKKASSKNFSCLYTTLSDIVNVLIQGSNEDKFLAKRELNLVDFLVIDELDPRFIASENAADLYARSLENIFRTRSQNKLPILMCTNSPNVINTFSGSLKVSLDSLMKGYIKMYPILGDDFRKKNL